MKLVKTRLISSHPQDPKPTVFVRFVFLLATIFLGFGAVPAVFAQNPADPPNLPGVSFVDIDDPSIPWKSWGDFEETGFSFMYDRIGDSTVPPESLFILFPGDPKEPCFLEPTLRQALADSQNSILIQPILDADTRLVCGEEDPLVEVCGSIRKAFSIPPERVVLVGERDRSETAITLASNHRREFGGIVVWEGSAGAALPPNLVDTSIAILGERNNLGGLQHFHQQCQDLTVPVRIHSYWGDVDDFELSNDLREVIDWMSRPEPRTIGRTLSHTASLPRYGEHGWIRITQLDSPGEPGVVRAHWTRTALVSFSSEKVRKFRVRLDSTFDRYGRRVFFSVGNLNLPVTLKREIEAVEFERIPDKDRWTARFVDFHDTVTPTLIRGETPIQFEVGEPIPEFSTFLRLETGAQCAWGWRFPAAIPQGQLNDEDLYRLVLPVPIIRVHWNIAQIDRFHEWQAPKGDYGFDFSFPPGVRSSAEEDPAKTIPVSVPLPILEDFHREQSEPMPDSIEAIDNLQHLLGIYLGREHLSSTASL